MLDVVVPLVSTFDHYDDNVKAAFLAMTAEAQGAYDSVTTRIDELQVSGYDTGNVFREFGEIRSSEL